MRSRFRHAAVHAAACALAVALLGDVAAAQSVRDRVRERRAARRASALPAGTRVERDVAYGADRAQRFDVYVPAGVRGAPIILMVHGGGWKTGDKDARNVVANKAARWLPRGFVFVSTNYRMLPRAKPVDQARDVARALAAVQARAAKWGGDPAKVILMGHSAGAHLVALLASSPAMQAQLGVQPWLGTIPLESGAMDVVKTMRARHPSLYDEAFGRDRAYWREASPFHALGKAGYPMLIVCSSRRRDACPQARSYVARATSLGMRAAVREEDLSHGQVNDHLGTPGSYTEAVEAFMRTLDPAVSRLLERRAVGAARR